MELKEQGGLGCAKAASGSEYGPGRERRQQSTGVSKHMGVGDSDGRAGTGLPK